MAPVTFTTLYVSEPVQTVEFPVILPGCRGTEFTVTFSVCAIDAPHELFAVTAMLPFEPVVAVMLLVLLAPLHPAGKVHV